MSEPLFRKGDVLIWNPARFKDTKDAGYIEAFGNGPFVCRHNIYSREELYNPQREPRVTLRKTMERGCFAWRLQRDEFLTAASKAVADQQQTNRSDKEKETSCTGDQGPCV